MKNIIKKWLGLDRFEECKECGVLCHRNKMKKIKAYILDEKTKVIESYYKYKEIKKYIEKSKSARERKNKNKFIAWLIFNKFHLKTETMTEELLEDIIVKASDYDRHWRKVLEENPTLRGSDYGDKQKVEQAKQIELGYESGYYKNASNTN